MAVVINEFEVSPAPAPAAEPQQAGKAAEDSSTPRRN